MAASVFNKLQKAFTGQHHDYEVDLVVIGGGSGGMATAKEAARLGARVVLFDYVKPTVHGTKWGLGGTCVNVGCIPKKLMHRSARLGHAIKHDANAYGWQIDTDNTKFDWNALVSTVQSYVKSLNFGYRNGLRSANVKYINAFATLKDAHTIKYILKDVETELTTANILVAVGGRPVVPIATAVPGAMEHAITSDDLFGLKRAPGKTLVVGASYIALECAGFLTEMGFDTTVAVRSIFLRGFDRQCADKIGAIMAEMGTKFLIGTQPTEIKKLEDGRLQVSFTTQPTDIFDTVLYAAGRSACTEGINLEGLGVKLSSEGKIETDAFDRSSVPGIYAIGDCAKGRPELTPVAIKAGELLARRLYMKGFDEAMDYRNVPTTVFTPVEYGCCGLSEEDAIAKYGEQNIETYLFEFSPIEVSAAHWTKVDSAQQDEYDTEMQQINLSKLVCLKDHHEQVVGFHCIGLNAGEMTQGYGLAVKAGLTKAHFDSVIGIHPTDAESFHNMTITRRSGESWVASGGCGGGKCG